MVCLFPPLFPKGITMVEHVNIADPDIHEPKGIAAASVGQVYIADGAGSGAWADPTNSVVKKRVLVQSATDLAGTLDSTVEYFIDGIIDMGTTTIEVPVGGLSITGYNFGISQLTSSAAGYTMFTSSASGSGDLIVKDVAFETSGTGSRLFNIVSATGFEAFEFNRVNFNNCSSLGTLDNYRQGFESGTGRFGGSPNLILKGTWLGGYFIDASIVRSLDAGFSGALYEAGAGFIMNSRFRSNQNIDLPASASFIDFTPANFANPSTLQLDSMIISRSGVFDATDINITPNISNSDLESAWSNNKGIPNTFEGGTTVVSTAATTTISAVGTFVDIAGTWASSDLQHFDEPVGGELRHLGDNPREYRIIGALDVEGPNADDVAIKVTKWDNSASSFVDIGTVVRPINNFTGGVDLAFITLSINVDLDQNDYVKLQIANNTTTGNLTVQLGSTYTVIER